jgi:hypothetical protein
VFRLRASDCYRVKQDGGAWLNMTEIRGISSGKPVFPTCCLPRSATQKRYNSQFPRTGLQFTRQENCMQVRKIFLLLIMSGLMSWASGCATSSTTAHKTASTAKPATHAPMLAVLDQFAVPDVPAKGPAEADPIPHSWPDPTGDPPTDPQPIESCRATASPSIPCSTRARAITHSFW